MSLALLVNAPCYAANPPTDRTPIQAQLVKAIEAGRVQAGDPVYAKVYLAWNHAGCKLREGAILKGRIITQTPRSKAAKSSGIALLFESGQCGGKDMKPLPLTVAAVLAPDPISGSGLFGDRENQPLNEAVGLSLNGGMRSLSAAAQTAILEPPRDKPPLTDLRRRKNSPRTIHGPRTQLFLARGQDLDQIPKLLSREVVAFEVRGQAPAAADDNGMK